MNAWGLKKTRHNGDILLQSIRHTEFECLQFSSYRNWEALQVDGDRVVPVSINLSPKSDEIWNTAWGVYDNHGDIILQTIRSTKEAVLEYFVKRVNLISGNDPPSQYVEYEVKRMTIEER